MFPASAKDFRLFMPSLASKDIGYERRPGPSILFVVYMLRSSTNYCVLIAPAGAIYALSSEIVTDGSAFFTNNSAGANGGEKGCEACNFGNGVCKTIVCSFQVSYR